MAGQHLVVLALLASLVMAGAAGAFTLQDTERVVPSAYRAVGLRHEVPYKILYAVALAESGYKAPSNGQVRPWPWTLNINGTSQRFLNRTSALAVLQQGINSGERNIDVGIAQINYQWNGDLFPSLHQAIDPLVNLQIAANILKRERARCETATWWCAVGRYHSPGVTARQLARAARYTFRVKHIWKQLQ